MSRSTRDAFVGCLLGTAAGDALGLGLFRIKAAALCDFGQFGAKSGLDLGGKRAAIAGHGIIIDDIAYPAFGICSRPSS